MGEEVVVPFSQPRNTLTRATEVRSTLITSSVQALRSHGYFGRYATNLPERHHDAILHTVAGMWLPMDLAVAHYRACEAIGLAKDEQVTMGRDVARRLEGTFLGTLLKVAHGAGVTPWIVLERFGRIYERIFVGGGLAIYRLGPKEARVEMVALPVNELAYFRAAFRGILEAVTELFCKKAYATELPKLTGGQNVAVRVAWA